MRDMPGHAFVAGAIVTCACVFGGPLISAQQGPSSVEQRVAALKQSIAESQARLRRYEWVETTIISLKGEEKDRKQQRCYYGADGTIQKVCSRMRRRHHRAAVGSRRRSLPTKRRR